MLTSLQERNQQVQRKSTKNISDEFLNILEFVLGFRIIEAGKANANLWDILIAANLKNENWIEVGLEFLDKGVAPIGDKGRIENSEVSPERWHIETLPLVVMNYIKLNCLCIEVDDKIFEHSYRCISHKHPFTMSVDLACSQILWFHICITFPFFACVWFQQGFYNKFDTG